jgi:hydroxymethylpyrimidine pyrophosphatase-like HAD family hydrolase
MAKRDHPMRYLALATDFDGTLTTHGRMATATVEALERVRASGRRLLLVSGRRLEDLVKVQPRLDLFDGLILENGAVLHWPATGKTELQCRPVPLHFTQMLRRRGVRPLDVGRVLVATCHPHEAVVLEAIYELGLELQVVFNGDAVMILPPNVNKGTGLQVALRALGLSRHEVVGIGDAANDHSFFAVCDCAVATANAIPGLKEEAAFTTAGADGAGVVELADALVADDLRQRLAGREEQELLLGTLSDGTPWWVHPRDVTLLVAGPSGGGKSTFAAGLIEQLVDHAYQVCVVDPEGDYDTLPALVATGSRLRPPVIPEVAGLLDHVSSSVSVNLIGMPLSDRPGFFEQLMPRLMTMRAHKGHPHWIVVDEAHHLLPRDGAAPVPLPTELVLVTVDPEKLAPEVLQRVDVVIACGPSPAETLGAYVRAAKVPPPTEEIPTSGVLGEAVAWHRREGRQPAPFVVVRARSERLRHLRKYAEGDLGPKSFVFRGDGGRGETTARNLASFIEIAGHVDDATWLHHLWRGDYSRWILDCMRDGPLADEVARIEGDGRLSAAESRQRVIQAIDARYTAAV